MDCHTHVRNYHSDALQCFFRYYHTSSGRVLPHYHSHQLRGMAGLQANVPTASFPGQIKSSVPSIYNLLFSLSAVVQFQYSIRGISFTQQYTSHKGKYHFNSRPLYIPYNPDFCCLRDHSAVW